MKESLLKKDFKESDLQRVRNIVNKDFTGKTKVGTGYSRSHTVRNEGDIWEEDGRTWTIRDGVRQNITKLDLVKQELKVPLSCPKCKGPMNHWLSKKMYKIHGFCFDPCTVEYETQLRKLGLYDQYEKRVLQGNIQAFSKDLEQWMLEWMEESDTFVTEQGDIEDWTNNSENVKTQEFRKIKEILNNLNSFLQQ